jgi:type II secretory pathway pseudopilin PulG
MTRRSGMSLTEVLVALFILTIGVIGILTMFPLAAAQMARAVRDDRSALAASNADAYMRWYWSNYVTNPVIAPAQATANKNFPTSDPFFANGAGLFDNPAQTGGSGVASLAPFSIQLQKAVGGLVGQISYPVIVDPMGFRARGTNFGDAPNFALIPRWSLFYGGAGQPLQPMVNNTTGNIVVQNQLQVFDYRSCSLVDSLGYNGNGTPTNDLEMRYNWMWVLQRPQMTQDQNSANPNAPINLFNQNQLSSVNMTVVVFDRRPFLFPPASVQGFETVMTATFTSGLTTVAISPANSQQALDLKPGSWVMDATVNPQATPFPIRQANFYRVVSVVEVNGQVNLELQTPISPPTGYPPLGFTYTAQSNLIALNGVSGVFVRAPLTPYP